MAKKESTAKTAQLPSDTIIEVIVHAPNDINYIFDIKFGDWLKMKKKPGNWYQPFEKGGSNYPNAKRVDYYKKINR